VSGVAIEVAVLLFGPLADAAAAQSVSVTVAVPATVGDVVDQVAERYPALRPRLGAAAVAVNLAYATRATPIGRDDEVALIPPVGGG
jgi:molybdopterin converting factor small subunit